MILEKTLPLIIIFLIGYFLKRKKILEKKDAKVFGKLLINLVIPIVIINSFSSIKLESNLLYLPLSALFVICSLTVLGFIFAKMLKLKNKTRSAFIISFPTFEGGTIGYSFMFAAFGEIGLSRIVLFDFVNAIFVFTFIYFLSCRFGNNHTSIKNSLIKVLKTPLIWAIFIGFFLNIINFQNALVFNLFDIISNSLLLLIMLMIGLEFHPVNLNAFKLPSITIFLKTSAGLMLGVLVSAIFGLSGIERIAVIVASTLPPSIMTLIFSEENNLDTDYSANLLSVALPFGIIFLTAILPFL